MGTRLGHRPALDGLRGLAIAAVVADHYFQLPGGWLGVDLFFVLSGFLITTLLLEERDQTGGISFRRFYIRRARRLLPALAGLLVVVLLGAPAGYGLTRTLGFVAVSAGYVANLATVVHHGTLMSSTPVAHLWSLSEEEQFYLVWPALLLILLRRCTERRVGAVLGVLFVVLVCYRGALVEHGASWIRIYFSPDTHADGLVIGCLVAVARRRGVRVRPWHVISAFVVIFCEFKVVSHNNFVMEYGLPVFEIAAAIAVLGAATLGGAVSSILSWKPLAWLGTVSYSLYLWHEPAQWLTGWAHPWRALALAMPLALVSYYVIERPLRYGRASTGVLSEAASSPG
jgi:peptidoglycan/LPS O-acetylase OafA/YrhL